MPPTDRAADQENFGAATSAQAQAENPALDPEMIDEGADEELPPEVVVKELFERVFNAGELDQVERYVAADHFNHDPPAPQVPRGPQGVRELVREYRDAFPDLRIEIDEIFAGDDRVAHRWRMTGTHEGEIMDIAPTGRRVEVFGIEINRIDRGKVAESW